MRLPHAPWMSTLGHMNAVLYLLVALTWGSSFLFAKIGLDGLAPQQVATVRTVLGALTLVAVLVATRRRWPREPRSGGTCSSSPCSSTPSRRRSWRVAEQTVPSGLASIYNATTPIMTLAALAVLVPSERLRGRQVAGIVLGSSASSCWSAVERHRRPGGPRECARAGRAARDDRLLRHRPRLPATGGGRQRVRPGHARDGCSSRSPPGCSCWSRPSSPPSGTAGLEDRGRDGRAPVASARGWPTRGTPGWCRRGERSRLDGHLPDAGRRGGARRARPRGARAVERTGRRPRGAVRPSRWPRVCRSTSASRATPDPRAAPERGQGPRRTAAVGSGHALADETEHGHDPPPTTPARPPRWQRSSPSPPRGTRTTSP